MNSRVVCLTKNSGFTPALNTWLPVIVLTAVWMLMFMPSGRHHGLVHQLLYTALLLSSLVLAYLLWQNRRLKKQLNQQGSVQYDALTGLPNRLALEARLQEQVEVSQKNRQGLAVLFIDLDDFKPINDSLGHHLGDRMLMEVAARLKSCLPEQGFLSRFGGDEFVVLLPNLKTPEEALPQVCKLLKAVARKYVIKKVPLQISASIGGSFYQGRELLPANTLIQQADMAMYKAKRDGHNQFHWYDRRMEDKLHRRVQLRSDLQQALDEEKMELHYQPLVNAVSGQVVGVEALLRWEHPEKGFLSPADFIPLAEETGQIIQLTHWTLEQACRDLNSLALSGVQKVAVNVSAVQLLKPGFIGYLETLLQTHNIQPGQLEIELTENVLLEDAELGQKLIGQLRQLGVGISMDDFGTGFSSLSYLKNLKVDKIKLDKSFIQDIAVNHQSAVIVETIISLAKQLGLSVVAEGVETCEQATLLQSFGCDYLQGFYFSRAIDKSRLAVYMLYAS